MTTLRAFSRLYEQVGLGWVYAITKYEPVSFFVPNLLVVQSKCYHSLDA